MIDTTLQVYLYDDRNKDDFLLKLVEVLYQDDQTCLGRFEPIALVQEVVDAMDPKSFKILFDLESREVDSEDFWSWLATDNQEFADELLADYATRYN